MNSITKLHLVDISTESSTMHGSMSIKDIFLFNKFKKQKKSLVFH